MCGPTSKHQRIYPRIHLIFIRHSIMCCDSSTYSSPLQNIIYLTVNLTEINEPTLQLNLQPNEISFEAKAGRYVRAYP